MNQNPINHTDPSGLDVYIWIREQNDTQDSGHAWIEVDQPGQDPYSLGSYPQGGLASPDNHHSDVQGTKYTQGAVTRKGPDTFRLAKVFKTKPSDDAGFIQRLKGEKIINDTCPSVKRANWHLSRKGQNLDAPNCTVCTSWVTRFLRNVDLDTTVPPDLIQPNNLYNHYNPQNPIPAGNYQTPLGDPLPP